jgi:hypothetical protein
METLALLGVGLRPRRPPTAGLTTLSLYPTIAHHLSPLSANNARTKTASLPEQGPAPCDTGCHAGNPFSASKSPAK